MTGLAFPVIFESLRKNPKGADVQSFSKLNRLLLSGESE
jgi:hypothetical protein